MYRLKILFFIFTIFGILQSQDFTEKLKECVEDYSIAFLEKEYEKLCDNLPDFLIQRLGGRYKAIEYFKSSIAEITKNNTSITDISIEEYSEIIKIDNEYFSIVTYKMITKKEDKIIVLDDYLICYSNNRGINWSIIAGSNDIYNSLSSHYESLKKIQPPTKVMSFIDSKTAKVEMVMLNMTDDWVPNYRTTKYLQKILNK